MVLYNKYNKYGNSSPKLSEVLKEKGVRKLIHITDYSNLPSILSKGLISQNTLNRDRISYTSNISKSVQRICKRNMKNNYGVDIRDYVRLFFTGNTPMLRSICFSRKKHNQTIVLQINPNVLDKKNSYFTDISCNRSDFELFNSAKEVDKLEMLDWEILSNDFDLIIRNCTEESKKNEYVGKRGAELLIPERISSNYISKKIFVFSFDAAGRVNRLLNENNIHGVKIKIDNKRKYFPAFPYSDVYWDKVNGNVLPANSIFERKDYELWKVEEENKKTRITEI
ncbi:hypothetical protein LCGC14_0525670 [marine sediment metagenome]|uniref:DarT domain-containing protein n=1 Tax=marine sediment metagenome TaxID=412755 RepID=A0A0F9S1T0_9ZZZZ|nr:DUF4433 domain-containing protein [bacterium]